MPTLDRQRPMDPTIPVAGSARTVPDLLLRRAAATPGGTAWKRKRAGAWVPSTWSDFRRSAAALATFLMGRGVASGDKVAIIGGTRPEWCISDLGGMLAGAVTVGAYPTLAPRQLAYLLEHADVRVALIEGKADLEKILEVKADVPKLELVLVWDTTGLEEALRVHAWLLPFGQALATKPDEAAIQARAAAVSPEATALIVYTSGTTGPPKGAMISHDNVLAVLRGVTVIPFDRADESLSFLPMAHVAERILAFYGRINHGVSTSYATSVPAVLDELKEVRPTVFGSVPRIFEKAYGRIMGEVGKAPPRRQRVFRWAEETARRAARDWQRGEASPLALEIQYAIADRLVYRKIRAAFGGRVRQFVTGAAPTPLAILEFFWGVGLPIYEAYGMTEATVITHVNRPGAVRLGSVGKALPYVEERIAEDGELLVRGKMVFQGYYKDPEATREAVDEDGWLHTGDVARKDEDGYVFIVDRKKHIIITSGGKNITPANIEKEIKVADSLISQVHAHGDRRAYCTALVTVHPVEAIEWAKERGLAGDAAAAEALRLALIANPLARPPGLAEIMARVTAHPELRARVVEAVRKANRSLSRVEAIRRVYLLDRDFSLEEDEITPTLKLKRKNIEKAFAPVFDRLYDEPGFGVAIEER